MFRGRDCQGGAPGKTCEFKVAYYLASILTALAGIETHLRSENGGQKKRLVELINESDIEDDLKKELHLLRKYRNKWVHVSDPYDDAQLLQSPETQEHELESIARRSVIALRRTVYANPWL